LILLNILCKQHELYVTFVSIVLGGLKLGGVLYKLPQDGHDAVQITWDDVEEW
jgi:hypothetical protein